MRYFPDPLSAWLFLGGLTTVLAIASYTDQRSMQVPKWLTLPTLAVGLVVSLLRGAWLAAHGAPVWILGESGVLLGGLDGLLFALAGFAVGFTLFLGMWLLGVCGGGDVKLFAALGAWIGPVLVIAVLAVSLVLLWMYVAAVLFTRLVQGRRLAHPLGQTPRARAPKGPMVVRYSLIATLAAIPVLLWAFRSDLRLVTIPSPNQTAEVRHAD